MHHHFRRALGSEDAHVDTEKSFGSGAPAPAPAPGHGEFKHYS